MIPKKIFDRFKSRLSNFHIDHMTRGDKVFDFTLNEEDLDRDLRQHGSNHRLLGRFSETEVRDALETYGVWAQLAKKGYPDADVTIRSLDPFRQSVKLVTSPTDPEDENHMLCELRVYDAWLKGPCPVTGDEFEIDALIIDWLIFQDPRGTFSAEREKLPGQKYPGLGILRTSLRAILDLARQSGKEAVVNIPEYYHNALLYQPAFRFFSPFVEGRFRALQKLLAGASLAEASNAVADGTIWNENKDEVFVWKPHEQVLGIAPRITEYFSSEGYLKLVEEAENICHFHRLPGKQLQGQ